MIKTIKIEDKNIKFSTSFAWMLKYKSQFHTDPATIIIPATQASTKDSSGLASIEAIGFINIARIAWSCAAVMDKEILPFEEWIDSFEDFSVVTVATELLPAVFTSFSSKKK